MTSAPHLIAHKVRGLAAFDIAERMPCPECAAQGCTECDDLGYWWIIPTSGHRAYPYGWQPMDALDLAPGFNLPMPDNWPDHYPTTTTPIRSAQPSSSGLLAKLGLAKLKTQIERRL